jgi:hypothetical protein
VRTGLTLGDAGHVVVSLAHMTDRRGIRLGDGDRSHVTSTASAGASRDNAGTPAPASGFDGANHARGSALRSTGSRTGRR